MPHRVQLIQGAGADFISSASRGWFERAAREALLSPTPWVVLTGSRALGHALKARLFAEGVNLGAVFFWTAGEAREFLRIQRATPTTLAVREHLHLLLALAADSIERAPREPKRTMRTLDRLHAAGLGADALDYPPAEQLARQLAADLMSAGWTTKHLLDWLLARDAATPAIAHLLVAGFDAAHFEQWPLLWGAVRHSREATVLLTSPRSKAERLDQVWIGTWEEHFGESEQGPAEFRQTPFAPLAQRMEFGAAQPTGRIIVKPVIRIGRTLQEQADAVVAQVLLFAADPAATRVGALFPGRTPLAREVSARLLERGVPHYDGIGFFPPPDSAAERWTAWSALQRNPTLAQLQRLLDLPRAPAAPPGLLDTLLRAATDVLVDDLPVLTARLRDIGTPESLDAAQFLDLFRPLPARDVLRGYCEQTRGRWTAMGWTDLLPALDAQWAAVASFGEREAALSHWLDWLDSLAPAAAPQRARDASNPLALIHLLPYAQAEGLDWSHLVMAGLNEGQWPPPPDAEGFLSDERIAALNQSALRQGRQGEGHWTLQPGRSLILGTGEQRELQRRQFFNLVEGVAAGLALTASLEDAGDSGRALPASDFLSHAYFCATGQPLTEERMRELQSATAAWLAEIPPPPRIEPPRQSVPVEQTGLAFRARRATAAFGAYECAFARASPPKPAHLSCKQWESAVRDPARMWMEVYLGVQPGENLRKLDLWPLAQGIWVHRWLAAALCPVFGRFEARRQGGELLHHIRRHAAATRADIARAFRAAGRDEPQWWRARVAQAEWLALQFGERLAELDGWPVAAVEWNLPRGAVHPAEPAALQLRGRIDTLFAPDCAATLPVTAWIADFKTGQDQALSDRNLLGQLARGNGVQLCLYALALANAGVGELQISLLNADALIEPQIDLPQIRRQTRFWDELARMQETGVFGIRGAVRAEFGKSTELPMATLPVESAVLEEKWLRTHPGLCTEDEAEHGD